MVRVTSQQTRDQDFKNDLKPTLHVNQTKQTTIISEEEKESLWVTRISYKIEGEKKLCKRDLNILALKFKLSKLLSNCIRYEVIYKNLLRDVRKYFTIKFNEATGYQKRRKPFPEVENSERLHRCLRFYVQQHFPSDLLAHLKVDMEELIFVFGSLIYTREILKMIGPSDHKKRI